MMDSLVLILIETESNPNDGIIARGVGVCMILLESQTTGRHHEIQSARADSNAITCPYCS